MQCLARVVAAILGVGAVAARKMEFGIPLVILGISVWPYAEGFRCSLPSEKAEKYMRTIKRALETDVLHPGCAQKLAGRLSWAAQHLFRRLGRAMLRPLFRRAHEG